MPTNKQLEAKLNDLAEVVEKVKENVDKLTQNAVAEVKEPVKQETAPMPASNIPFPAEYRQIVDEVLNKEFGAEIQYNALDFAITIIVPEQYQNLSQQEKDAKVQDRRTKIIKYPEGASGVKAWVDMVYGSFNPEMKAKITSNK